MIVDVSINFIVNTGLAVTLGIWGYKFSKSLLEFLISEHTKAKRRPVV